MINLSMMQALSIWSELEQAYYGNNKYGGDTAEIYAYRLQPANPKMWLKEFRQEAWEPLGVQAAQSLYELLRLFCQMRECRAEIDGEPYDKQLPKTSLVHRCHIKIIKLAND